MIKSNACVSQPCCILGKFNGNLWVEEIHDFGKLSSDTYTIYI
jgi:hypothetical protein